MPVPYEIKSGNILFTNEIIYSQKDKERNKYCYEAEIKGLKIIVSNHGVERDGIYFEFEGIQKSYFKNKEISIESAIEYTLKHLKTKLNEIINEL